jgi:hypothetical protein
MSGYSIERTEELRQAFIAALEAYHAAKVVKADAGRAYRDAEQLMWDAESEAQKAYNALVEYMGIPKGYQ